MRVLLETSIAHFVRTGLGVYTRALAGALGTAVPGLTVVEATIPAFMRQPRQPLVQKLFAAYWQIAHAQFVLPLMARRHKVDLVHYTVPMVVSDRLPCPAVVTIHDIIPVIYPEWVQPVRGARMRRGMMSAAMHARHLVADSDATRNDLIAHLRVPPDRVTVVPLGADHLEVLADSAVGDAFVRHLDLRPGYVLCVGSLEPRKNLARVIEAFALLRQGSSDATQLVIVGGANWGAGQLHQQVEARGLAAQVRFTGHVDARELAALYSRAGLFVYPSLYEGFGLPLLEAMTYGCPVVASNRSSLPEVVGDDAVLIDPTDVGSLAEGMSRVLNDPAFADALRVRGRLRAARYTWGQCAEETAAVYRKVLA